MASSGRPSLKALVVFRNYVFRELVRAVHVYGFKDVSEERVVEREYLFDDPCHGYKEIVRPGRVFTLQKFDVNRHYPGLTDGVWYCVFVFHEGLTSVNIPEDLSLSGNPNLALLRNLVRDLDTIHRSVAFDDAIDRDTVTEASGIRNNVEAGQPSLGTPKVPLLDLNSLPSEAEDDQETLPMPIGTKERKYNRDAAKDISLDDITKHFNGPIVEASKALNVGLTLLKKRCRQFGIPRWPHRKIRSLRTLINDLQGEFENQVGEDVIAALAVAEKQKMIESEKERIVKKPSLDLRLETKKIRQEMFKQKYKARLHGTQSPTLPLF